MIYLPEMKILEAHDTHLQGCTSWACFEGLRRAERGEPALSHAEAEAAQGTAPPPAPHSAEERLAEGWTPPTSADGGVPVKTEL